MKNFGVKSKIQLTINSGYYDEKYMKSKFNFDGKLPLNKIIESLSMDIVVRADFHENNKYYQQFS